MFKEYEEEVHNTKIRGVYKMIKKSKTDMRKYKDIPAPLQHPNDEVKTQKCWKKTSKWRDPYQ